MSLAVLSIAGSDPSGGAGIQADLKTFTALGCYGTSVLTALTAQNTTGVKGVHACPPQFVKEQLEAVLDDIPVRAIKTGMLHDAATIEIVVDTLSQLDIPIVVDPVMVSTSGHQLLEQTAIQSMRSKLLPLARIVTPNVPEMELLLSEEGESVTIKSIQDMKVAASRLAFRTNASAVLLKGGHLSVSVEQVEKENSSGTNVEYADVCSPKYPAILRSASDDYDSIIEHGLVVDVLYESPQVKSGVPERFTLFTRPRIDTTSTHGTGCTLSSALACELARGHSVLEATRRATEYTHIGIATATPIGKGNGPLNHLHPLTARTIPLPTPDSPYPFINAMIRETRETWNDYVQHPFVQQLGKGTLRKESFAHFMQQDYLYLQYYARAHGLLAAKSKDFASIQSSAQIMLHITRESKLHESFCAQLGVSLNQNPADKSSELLRESSATTAYGAFIIDAGLRGDDLSLIVALAACLLGYGEVGLWLVAEAKREGGGIFINGNPYEKWILDYSGSDYQAACRTGIHALEARIAANPPSPARYHELTEIWRRCVELEKSFWDMALSLSCDEYDPITVTMGKVE